MNTALQVQAPGLVAAAQRLSAAASQLTRPGVLVHPALASDQTSVAAAARLGAAAEALQSVAAGQATALIDTAEHLCAIAARFTEQEALNAATVQALRSATEPIGSPGPLAPVPPIPADTRLPMPLPVDADGEAVAQQLWAGSASAGVDFAWSWRNQSAAFAAARDVIRDVLPMLPELWNSPAGAVATVTRLWQHDDALATVADRAAALADQAVIHARGYRGAVANTPNPAEFEAVRARLSQALEANTRSPGRYTPLVSSLIARQGALRQQALSAQTQYHEEVETAWRSGEQAGPLAGQLPGMVPGLLGAVGGVVGGAIAAAVQAPQALVQSGQQLLQSATQGLSGLAMSAASGTDSAAKGFDANTRPDSGVPGGPADIGATAPAGATDKAPVSPSTSSAPPPTTTLPQGTVAAGTVPAAGTTAVPMGMPIGMAAPPAAVDAGQHIAAGKKIVVPAVPHTESVTGRAAPERLASAAARRSTHRRIALRTIEDDLS